MNQEEADQDVVDEVSEEVDSRGRVMRSERPANVSSASAKINWAENRKTGYSCSAERSHQLRFSAFFCFAVGMHIG